jgi:hypothetical protein
MYRAKEVSLSCVILMTDFEELTSRPVEDANAHASIIISVLDDWEVSSCSCWRWQTSSLALLIRV